MLIGVPKEIKTNENRIALVPAGAEALVGAGHEVFVEKGGGEGSGFPDAAFEAAVEEYIGSMESFEKYAVKKGVSVECFRPRPKQVAQAGQVSKMLPPQAPVSQPETGISAGKVKLPPKRAKPLLFPATECRITE